MCLAIPGKIVEITKDEADPIAGHVATVDFQGSRVEVSLAMTPEAAVGGWVLVHAGFAITLIDEDDARETWEYLSAVGAGEVPAELRSASGAAEPDDSGG